MSDYGSSRSFQAVVWDFDGTLVRRPDMWCAAIAESIRLCGGPAYIRAAHFAETAYLYLPWNGTELRHYFLSADLWWEAFFESIATLVTDFADMASLDFPLFKRTVRSIIVAPERYKKAAASERAVATLHDHGVSQFVLSNHVPELPEIVGSLFPGKFRQVWTSGTLGFEKPRSEAFRFALNEIGLPSRSVLMIGDDLHRDLDPAGRAGMQTLHVRDVAKLGQELR